MRRVWPAMPSDSPAVHRRRLVWAYRPRLMRGDTVGPDAAACQDVGRSLQAYCATQVDRLLVHGCKSSVLD